MNAWRQPNLDSTIQEALRALIGEQRFALWFAKGVRYELSSDALTVLIENEFLLSWISSSFAHYFKTIANAILMKDARVEFALDLRAQNPQASADPTNEQQHNPAIPNPEPNRDILSFPSARGDAPSRPTLVSNPTPEENAPKRRRGRPRKNPDQVDANLAANAPANEEPSVAPPLFQNEPIASTTTPPAKRRRGRPRKNPIPEQTLPSAATPPTVATTANAPVAPNGPIPTLPAQALEAILAVKRDAKKLETSAAANPPESFVDAFAARAANVDLELAPNLSEQERRALALGAFAEQSDVNPPQTQTRGKRGRPKGSTNRKKANADAARENDGDEVTRDEFGQNVVRIKAKEPGRVKAEDGATLRYARLTDFIEGPSNALARRCVDIATLQPGAISPMILCGPTSVGKTHLLEGACDACARAGRKPLYLKGADFLSLYVSSMNRSTTSGSFRSRFNGISLLALDEIDFLEGKGSGATETELIHVYDYLRARNVQMIFASSRPLTSLNFKSELQTRLQSGMVCNIENPERETLAKIFWQLALERRLALSEEVCRYVVANYALNARDLSGALNSLYATHLATGSPIDLELAKRALADRKTTAYRNIRLADVERVVQEYFGLESNALKSASRAKKCADPRALAMWLARKHTRAALSEIGEFFGGRRHTSVISAQKKVERWLNDRADLDAPDGVFAVDDTIARLERALSVPRS